MNVSLAVTSRRSVRAFLDKPVELETLQRILDLAQRSPSAGNIQPWNAVVLTGDPLRHLVQVVADAIPKGQRAQRPDHVVYPADMPEVYVRRRDGVGEAMNMSLGIARDDAFARLRWFSRNFQAFGAPVLMLVHTPRCMGAAQWSDIGMWMQTVMLLLREKGLDSCAQGAWVLYSHQIRRTLSLPEDHVLVCGISIGWRDPQAAVNQFDVPRAPWAEPVRFEGF